MTEFTTRRLPDRPDAIAPDGSEVRVLAATAGGSMAHFRLSAGQVSRAVTHRTVDEIWFVVEGRGRVWRRSDDDREEVTGLEPGLSLSIPVGTTFQFRADSSSALEVVGVTVPPWPGDDEAEARDGPWSPTL